MHFLVHHAKHELHNVMIKSPAGNDCFRVTVSFQMSLYFLSNHSLSFLRENLFVGMLQDPQKDFIKEKADTRYTQGPSASIRLEEMPLEAESVERGHSSGSVPTGLPKLHGFPLSPSMNNVSHGFYACSPNYHKSRKSSSSFPSHSVVAATPFTNVTGTRDVAAADGRREFDVEVHHAKHEFHNVMIKSPAGNDCFRVTVSFQMSLYFLSNHSLSFLRENLFVGMLQDPQKDFIKEKADTRYTQGPSASIRKLEEMPLEAESVERGHSSGSVPTGLPKLHGFPLSPSMNNVSHGFYACSPNYHKSRKSSSSFPSHSGELQSYHYPIVHSQSIDKDKLLFLA
ncbi:hypothetical protein LINPERPRIM_LOCUS5730 [Linum perenne]